MATYDLTQGIPSNIEVGDILNCPYSGSAISLTLPKGSYRLECWGARGGGGIAEVRGKGGYAAGTLNLASSTEVYIYSGGSGSTTTRVVSKPGGFNGGGAGGGGNLSSSGGGGTDIRLLSDSLYNRVIVAGGGGGGCKVTASSTSAQGLGGYGGGMSGGSGKPTVVASSYSDYPGAGAKAYSGGSGGTGPENGRRGSFGIGGDGGGSTSTSEYANSGGGGGGWYGGGGGASAAYAPPSGSGGGGSGFTWRAYYSSYVPSNYALGEEYYLTDYEQLTGNSTIPTPSGDTATGWNSSGYARITVLSLDSLALPKFKMNGEWATVSSVSTKVTGEWLPVTDIKVKQNGEWINAGA